MRDNIDSVVTYHKCCYENGLL